MALKRPLLLASSGGVLAQITDSDTITPTVLATGTRDGTRFLRDDGTWGVPTASQYVVDSQAVGFTLTAADFVNGYVRANFAAPGTITIPPNASVPCPVGTPVLIAWVGGNAGIVSIAPGAGVTLRNLNGASFSTVRLMRPGALVAITQVAANVWEFVGPTDVRPIGAIYRASATTTVNNTTTATSLVQSANGVGFKTIRGSSSLVGDTFDLYGGGVYSTPLSPSNSSLVIKLGSTVLDTSPISGAFAGSAVNLDFWMDARVTVRATGASGSVVINGIAQFMAMSGAIATVSLSNGGAPVAVDLSVDQDFDVIFQWSGAQAGQRIDLLTAVIHALT